MSKNFGDFIEDTTPETGQYVVGYDTPSANGERRFAIGNISGSITDTLSTRLIATGDILYTDITNLSGVVTGILNTGLETETGIFTKTLTISGVPVSTGVDPGGEEPQFQFNSGNTFQGASALTYDPQNHRVAVGTSITGGTFTPAHALHISGSGESIGGTNQCRDIESGGIQTNFGAQVGTGAWDTGVYDYLFMASGMGVFLNYELLPSSNPNVRGQVYRDGTNQLYISNG
mgnify:CR=1 FL=1